MQGSSLGPMAAGLVHGLSGGQRTFLFSVCLSGYLPSAHSTSRVHATGELPKSQGCPPGSWSEWRGREEPSSLLYIDPKSSTPVGVVKHFSKILMHYIKYIT